MTTTHIELTMQELAQTALGVPKITGFNLKILHSLIDLILKKLDCQNDTVITTGHESVCFQQMLRESKVSPLPFNDEKMEMISTKLKKIKNLEERLAVVERKLQDHFNEMQKHIPHRLEYDSRHWEKYSKVSEDMCVLSDGKSLVSCQLLNNPHFVRTLKRIVGEPLAERMQDVENKVEELHLQIVEFKRFANERYKKIVAIDGVIVDIERFRDDIEKEEKKFWATMDEIQILLSAKVDKLFIPTFKNYIRKSIEDLQGTADNMLQKHVCKMPEATNKDGDNCVSCGGVKTCTQRPFHVHKPYDWSKIWRPEKPPFCGCIPVCLNSEQEELLRQHVKNSREQQEKKSRQPQLYCKPPKGVFDVLRGDTGTFYRKG